MIASAMDDQAAPVRVRVAFADGGRDYDVVIGSGLLAGAAAAIAPLLARKRVFVLSDRRVAALHLPVMAHSFETAGIKLLTHIRPPGEGQKSFAVLEETLDWLLAASAERSDVLLALGGGVIGDLGGLAAGLMKRGMRFVQVPTTLLAQVDSAVGGKTAINAKAGKNLVGLFFQPQLVLADLDCLATLPLRERRAGYSEIVKYGLLGDRAFFEWCEQRHTAVLDCDAAALREAVAYCVAAKAAIVSADERETGRRALLNLGHTFGHAFEAIADFGPDLLHGEAVAAGMALAFDFSAQTGLCDRAEASIVRRHLAASGFELDPRLLPGPLSVEAMVAAMRQDKKNADGALTLVLARGIGRAEIVRDVDIGALEAFLHERLGA